MKCYEPHRRFRVFTFVEFFILSARDGNESSHNVPIVGMRKKNAMCGMNGVNELRIRIVE